MTSGSGALLIMTFDQFSLLAAIAFAAGSLCLTLLVTWLGSRADRFLLSWAAGMALLVGGIVAYGESGDGYHAGVQLASFGLLILGFAAVYAGALQFCRGQARWRRLCLIVGPMLAVPVAAFSTGWTGLGTSSGNIALAVLTGLSAREYYHWRKAAPVPMLGTSVLYAATAVSFLLCGLVLLANGQFVLDARPENWAEQINSIMLIVGLSGIGALSLALNQSRAAQRHKTEAQSDWLTGLLNRRAVFELHGRRPVEVGTAIIHFDLDRFKDINDAYGHAAGDVVLRRFAEILRSNCAHNDHGARLGGEEFCIVLPACAAHSAAQIAERIRIQLEQPRIVTPEGAVTATVSAGIAVCLVEPESFEALLSRADAATYQAKRNGRNQVYASHLRLVPPTRLATA